MKYIEVKSQPIHLSRKREKEEWGREFRIELGCQRATRLEPSCDCGGGKLCVPMLSRHVPRW